MSERGQPKPGDVAVYIERPIKLRRVLGIPGLYSAAYGNVGSSIYYALGVVAMSALGLTPAVLAFSGILFLFTALTYAEGATMLPEAGWDPSLPRILNDLGLSYIIMGGAEIKRDFPAMPDDFFHRPFRVNGISGSSAVGLVMNAFIDEKHSFYIEGGIIQGPDENVRDFDACVRKVAGEDGGTGRIMVCKNDAEFVYEGTMKAKYGTKGDRGGYWQHMGESLGDEPARRAAEMKKGWDRMCARSDLRFRTVSEYLAENPPGRSIDLRPSYKAHREWLEGSEKLAAMLDETRNEIRRAEYALKLARKMGRNVSAARNTVRQAWLLLLEAEISTGRRACAHEAGKATRVYRSMELAVKAAKLAEESVELVE